MNRERHERAKEFFASARELSPELVAHFLDGACGDDRELRQEVAVLLSLHRELERAEVSPPKLEMVGHFRVLRLVGEGGMGEVWEAEQVSPVRRRVAVKLIKWGMDTREVLARFEAERQALALMRHPNIAAVYEAGADDDGRPFFAMEFVDGVNINDFCDAGCLAIEDRLRIFREICDGVQHAHHKGVIHRDIKPSNILVAAIEGRPLPKIIDFGVAKAVSQRLTERTLATELGHWIGTPEYMSPEQAAASDNDVDTRTDVYSLGVLLYELLAGVPPLDARDVREAGFDEMRRQICEQEAPRPSTRVNRSSAGSVEVAAKRRTDVAGLRRALRGDLDWIVLKALEKDRSRRYGSPAELAADIGRHLRHEPVTASPPSALYRFGKYLRRNRIAVGATAVVFAAVITGAAMMSLGFVRARDEAESARRVSTILESVLLDFNPRSRTGSAARVTEIIDHGVEKIHSELAGRPLDEARMLQALGVARAGFGDVAGARPLLEKARDLRLRHLGPDHLDYATSCFYLGDLLIDVEKHAGALQLHETAYGIRERQLPPDHRLVILSAERVAMCHGIIGNFEASLGYLRRVLAAVETNRHSVDPEVEGAVLAGANVACFCGDINLARSLVESTRVYSGGSSDPRSLGDVVVMFNLAAVVDLLGDSERAADLSDRALAAWRELEGPEDRDFAAGLFVCGRANLNAGRARRAHALFTEAAALDRRIAIDPEALARWRQTLARPFLEMGDTAAAMTLLEEAVECGLPAEAIRDDSELAGLRSHPGYQGLLARAEARRSADLPSDPSLN